jgi:tetratricopeptide (TPR) repeat protein
MSRNLRSISSAMLLITIAATAIGAPALAASPEMDRGIKYFNSKHYAAAVTSLTAAIAQRDGKNPLAHYYLGNALLQVGKKSEALVHFRTAWSLSPKGEAGKASYNVLKTMGPDAFKMTAPEIAEAKAREERAKAVAARLKSVKEGKLDDLALITATADGDALTELEKVPTEVEKPKIVIDTRGLPAIPSYSKGPHISMVKRWDYQAQADFLSSGDAQVLRTQVSNDLAAAQRDFTRAEAYLRIYIPTKRLRGETAQQFQERYDIATAAVEEALKPYRDNLAERQQAVKDASSITNICTSASRKLDVEMYKNSVKTMGFPAEL